MGCDFVFPWSVGEHGGHGHLFSAAHPLAHLHLARSLTASEHPRTHSRPLRSVLACLARFHPCTPKAAHQPEVRHPSRGSTKVQTRPFPICKSPRNYSRNLRAVRQNRIPAACLRANNLLFSSSGHHRHLGLVSRIPHLATSTLAFRKRTSIALHCCALAILVCTAKDPVPGRVPNFSPRNRPPIHLWQHLAFLVPQRRLSPPARQPRS